MSMFRAVATALAVAALLSGTAASAMAQDHRPPPRRDRHYHRPPPPRWGYNQPGYVDGPPPVVYAPPEPPPLVYGAPGLSLNFSFR